MSSIVKFQEGRILRKDGTVFAPITRIRRIHKNKYSKDYQDAKKHLEEQNEQSNKKS